jgi:colicin import membrane protein
VTPKPSANYAARLIARFKPNITFTDAMLQSVVGNPAVHVEVTCSPTGRIESVDLVKSSGNSAWDEAVIDGLRKTKFLPRDENGIIPLRKIQFMWTPRE